MNTWFGILEVPLFLAMGLGLCMALWLLQRSRRREAVAAIEARHLLERTQAEREWFEMVLGSITEEVYFTDRQGRYRYVNDAVLREFGHDAVEGVPVEHIVSPMQVFRPDGTPRPIGEAPPLRALRGETVRNEEQILRHPRTGELRHRQVSSAPVRDAGGTIIGSVSVAHDITERKRIEQALREADRRKTVFIATLSHELRNPLAPIRAAAHVLESPVAGATETARARAVIVRQVAHMVSLLDDLLNVSRFMRGDLVLKKERVPLQQLLDAALETAQPLLSAKNHRLQVNTPRPAPLVEVDPVRFTQVISNLLTNAAKYTDEGGTITLACDIDADRLRLAVRDTGIGLSAESIERIFTMFVQLEPDPARTQGGLGIGLALVKAIVELHGGRVGAFSAGPGKGSTFTVEMPAEVIVEEAAREFADPAPGTKVPRRILVADDNLDAAQALGMMLEMSGHEVHLANDGAVALALAARVRPDIAVLDIGMPGMSGHEAASAMRSQPWGRDMLLIALTGWGQESDRERALRSGFDLHFTKPVEPEVLEAAVARARSAQGGASG